MLDREIERKEKSEAAPKRKGLRLRLGKAVPEPGIVQSINQLEETGIAIELAAQLIIQFSYGHLSGGEYYRFGQVPSAAETLP